MASLSELRTSLTKIEEQITALSAEKAKIEAELKEAEKLHAKEALAKIVSELKSLNLDPSEVAKALGVSVAAGKQKAVRGTAVAKTAGVPKYRSSVDPTLTWTGKGRKPGWIQTFLDNGGNLEDWLIKN